MKKCISVILCVLMIAALFSGCGQKSEETASGFKGEVKIGVSVAITGSQPLDGDGGTKGAQMAIDEINAAGGINGYKLVGVFEDDANDATATINVANKFGADESILCMIGMMRSGCTTAISDTVAQYKMPTLQGGGSLTIDELNNPYLFRFRLADKLVAKVAAGYCVDTLGKQKIGVLHCSDDYGKGALTVIENYLSSIGMTVVASEAHNQGDTDMSAGLLKLKNAGCDAIIVWSHGAECAIIARQYRELEMDDIPLFGGPGFVNAAFYAAISDHSISNGTYSAADWSLANPNEFAIEFVEKYNAKYGENPNTASSFWYDAVYIVADALSRCSEMTRENLYNELFNVGKNNELILNCGKVYCDDERNFAHEVLLGVNESNSLKILEVIKE